MFISAFKTSGFKCDSVMHTTSGLVRSHHSLRSGTLVWSHFGKRPLQFHSIRLFIGGWGHSIFDERLVFEFAVGLVFAVFGVGLDWVVRLACMQVLLFVHVLVAGGLVVHAVELVVFDVGLSLGACSE